MPEIPFVQTLVDNLLPHVRGRVIRGIQLRSPSLLKTVEPPLGVIVGVGVQNVRRRGKLVLLDLSNDLAIVLHLMRDGRLQLVPASRRSGKDVALALRFDAGPDLRLVELGPKKRTALYVRRAAEAERTEPVAGLGQEPLDAAFTLPALEAMLGDARTQLKRFLELQRYVAGIGNAYSDEILWEARLSPFAPSQSLSPEERVRLHAAIGHVLARAVEEHGAHFAGALPMKEPLDLLRIHRHAKEPCPRCGTPIAVVHYSEKETYYCPTCQTGGRVYADRRLSRLLR
ncbi:MAG: Fpg/Nei family DNA glycosylase [Armatimonadetes bacterium]|nr:Fpg/Nei family DNA glycosylase [Armatimonadota bacterium]